MLYPRHDSHWLTVITTFFFLLLFSVYMKMILSCFSLIFKYIDLDVRATKTVTSVFAHNY